MKNVMIIMGALLLLWSTPAEAQFLKKLTKKLEKKLDQTGKKLEDKADKQIDKMLDLGEDDATEPVIEEMGTMESTYPDDMEEMQDVQANDTSVHMNSNPSFESYTKYDFVPGETLEAFEDFSDDAIGDFPQRWNTSASSEVVTLSSLEGNWMRIGQGKGGFTFDGFSEILPEDFTLEFDFVFDFPADSYAFKRYFNVVISNLDDPNKYLSKSSPSKEYVALGFTNGSGSGRHVVFRRETSQSGMDMSTNNPHPFFSKGATAGVPAHIAILKKGKRLKVYVNEDKVIDVPRAFVEGVAMKSLRFQSEITPADQHFYLSNLKFATGVNSSERLFDNGSYQAHGITFESGSSQIEAASYATLKEIARAITSGNSQSYLIVGHTDSDGDDTVNIPLSQQRAQAVREALVHSFEIDPSVLQTDGVGSTQPLSYENTITAKAQNRRVEIKRI